MPRNNKEWIESYQIFDKYEGYQYTAAEHDEMWAGPQVDVVSEEDKKRLKALGWGTAEGILHTFV